jgi:CheY-like chemotaxis protein
MSRPACFRISATRSLKRGQPIDILVTDHLMPRMNGTKLARHVQEARADLPVLLVSGYAELDEVDVDRPRPTKPLCKDELAATLLTLAG